MSKRGENIYKRKDGRWEGRYIKERSADGKARYAYVYGKSYADAKQKLLDRRITQAQNIDCSPSHTKYGDILRNWIAMSRIHIKESTYSRYVHLANAHILPYLGELPTGKLTTQTVEKHISFLLNKGRVDKKGGLAPKTVSDILTLIKGSIDYANCSGYSVNCYLDRLTVKKTQLDMRVLSVDEQHRLCDILMRDMNLTKFGVLLCMYTGIRIGEVCALKWERIDFSEGILSIRETLQRIQATDVGACKKTKIVITEPKSKKAVRDIPLPGFVLEYAASLKHNPNVHQGDNLTGAGDGDDEQIMVNLPMVPSNIEKMVFVVNIYDARARNQHFGMIRNAFIRLVDVDTGTEICRFNLSENYNGMTGLVVGEIYKRNGDWKFNAIGQPVQEASRLDSLIRLYI